MSVDELITLFRKEVADKSDPPLWDDSLVAEYIDEAQKQFCRDTWGLEDSRSFKIKTLAGIEWYKLDQKILRLLGATKSGVPVPITTVEQSPEIRFDGRTGATKAIIKGLQRNQLRLWPIPTEETIIELRTLRISNTVGEGDDLEIDEQHHRSLILWAKHKAYNVQDSEMYDKTLSEKFAAEFKAYCSDAKRAQGRLRRHIAVVQFRGI